MLGHEQPKERRPETELGLVAFAAKYRRFGAPCRARTCDLPLRRRLLYPTELRALKRAAAPSYRVIHEKVLQPLASVYFFFNKINYKKGLPANRGTFSQATMVNSEFLSWPCIPWQETCEQGH
jgi:hypothetical protein